MKNLLEDTRQQLLTKTKSGADYKGDKSKGRNRYARRTQCQISSSTKSYNNIDMNKFFSKDILDVSIVVHGERHDSGEQSDYQVRLSFGGVISRLKDSIERNNGKFEFKVIVRSLIDCFNKGDVYIFCSCLHKDTHIKLLDGTTPTVEEMLQRFQSGEQLYVYSVDENGDFKPGIVEKVWVTGNRSDFIEVTLDNDEKILTTPEHLYMLRDGSYMPACDLQVGQSLMPLYFNEKNGYELVKPNSSKGWRAVYKEVADYFKGNEIQDAKLRAKPEDNMKYEVAIHHKDFDKKNNTPQNLQVMTAREHWDYHANFLSVRRKVDKEFDEKLRDASRRHCIELNTNPTEKLLEARKSFLEKGRMSNYDPERKSKQSDLMRRTIKKWRGELTEEQLNQIKEKVSENKKKDWADGKCYTDKFKEAAKIRGEFLKTPEVQEMASEGSRRYWKNISDEERNRRAIISRENAKKGADKIRGTKFSNEHKKKISDARKNFSKEKNADIARKTNLSKIHNVLMKVIESGLNLTEENYEIVRASLCGYPKISKCFDSVESAVSYFQLNHKIKDIRYITLESQPVYDIKVKDFENFLVEPGVILHNCPDFHYRMGYWLSVHDIIIGSKETRPSDITNPKDNLGPACKHIALVLANLSWIYKVASAINNYTNYMESHYPDAYKNVIYPALYGKEYEGDKANLKSKTLGTDTELVKRAHEYGSRRGQFQKGNTQGVRFAKETDEPVVDEEN